MNIVIMFISYSFFSIFCNGQQTIIQGTVIDSETLNPLSEVIVSIESHLNTTKTDGQGRFLIDQNVPLGTIILTLEKDRYIPKRYPLTVKQGEILLLENLVMDYNRQADNELQAITIHEDELNEDDDVISENVSGLLQSSKDVFLRAAAYDFSATFFRPRGLGSQYGSVLINGIPMNKINTGRPLWANWGGLNDAQRNQKFEHGLSPNDFNLNSIAGATNIIMRASNYRNGGRINFSTANKSYSNRLMVSYNSGITSKGWSYSLLGSYRYAKEGYIDGTSYKSLSIFTALEKQISTSNALNVSILYSKNLRGRASPITSEIFKLKNRRYNSNWGFQDGKIRNSKTREINEPILMLNHYWNMTPNITLNSNVAYQFGTISNTRIDYGGTRLLNFNGQESYVGGAINPDPSYYQNLPSYFLNNSSLNPSSYDYEQAFLAEKEFKNNGQLDWENLYESNKILASQGYPAIYAVQADKQDSSQFWINTLFNASPAFNQSFTVSANYRNLRTNNYAQIGDLIGGENFLDIDVFAEANQNSSSTLESVAQSDLRNKNRYVKTGDRYKYDYTINYNNLELFLQSKRSFKNIDFHIATNISFNKIYRLGNFENGHYPGSGSFGPSEKIKNFNYGIKLGGHYKINAKHVIEFCGLFLTKTQPIDVLFENPRQNNEIINPVKPEQINAYELNYFYRSNTVKSRLTGYHYTFNDQSNLGYYFTENLASLGLTDNNAFVQEITTDISSKHLGLEFGMEYRLTSTLNLKASAAIGQFIYTDNPSLYLRSNAFDGKLTFGDGSTNLKGFHMAAGPEKAAQLGFDYRDPDYWWFGATANYFSDAYINISKLSRSANFILDYDGLPLIDYNPTIAKRLLEQEKFPSYMLVNIIGGKSWLINGYYIGLFAVINNVFNQSYISGGYEQSRLANYTLLKQDKLDNDMPVFGPRYYYGNGTTYFINMYLKF